MYCNYSTFNQKFFFVHQGALCGKTLNYSLVPGDNRNLKSPKYPAGFSSQTQCVWQISSPPGTRIRVDFDVFQMAATGRACHTVYLEFSSISMDVLGNEMPGANCLQHTRKPHISFEIQ